MSSESTAHQTTTKLTESEQKEMERVRHHLIRIMSKEITEGDRRTRRWRCAAMFLREAMEEAKKEVS